MPYIKHLIECNCTLPQFRDVEPAIFHKFVVFSEFDKNGNLMEKITKCPNCELVHKILDVGKSKVLPSEKLDLTMNEEEIKLSFPEKLLRVINKHTPPIHVLEHIEYVLRNKRWGENIILSSQEDNGIKMGKKLQIISEDRFKIEPFKEKTIVE